MILALPHMGNYDAAGAWLIAEGAGSATVVAERVKPCTICGNFTADELCRICLDTRRDDSVLCVVSRVQDLLALERAGGFRGRYHVLHGLPDSTSDLSIE